MKKLMFQYDPGPLQQNPALRAWLQVAGSGALPVTIDSFIGQHNRSRLYRFQGVGEQGLTVIAKSAEPKSLEKEYNVYVHVLPHLPLPRLNCYGISQDEEGCTWLFLEEARGLSYRDNDPLHVEQVSHWLGAFHAATTGRFREYGFPEIGFDHYAPTLGEAITRIGYFRKEAERDNEMDQLMGDLEAHLFRIRSEWVGLKHRMAILPSCIAHLDFVKKNIRIDLAGSRPQVQVMDWGSSRYGMPVRDMAGLNMQVYQEAGRHMGMKLTREELKLGEQVGQLVKTVLFLYEEMSNPDLLKRMKSIDNLKAYERTFSSFWKASD